MPRLELPENIAQLHLAFGRKKLTGDIKLLADKLKTFPAFKEYCKNAKKFYGLTPRQLCIQFAMCQVLDPTLRTGNANWLSGYFRFSRTVQGHMFWRAINYGT